MKDGQKLTHSLNPSSQLLAGIPLVARLRLPESRRVVPELQACSRAVVAGLPTGNHQSELYVLINRTV
jgi:hypothetical protein